MPQICISSMSKLVARCLLKCSEYYFDILIITLHSPILKLKQTMVHLICILFPFFLFKTICDAHHFHCLVLNKGHWLQNTGDRCFHWSQMAKLLFTLRWIALKLFEKEIAQNYQKIQINLKKNAVDCSTFYPKLAIWHALLITGIQWFMYGRFTSQLLPTSPYMHTYSFILVKLFHIHSTKTFKHWSKRFVCLHHFFIHSNSNDALKKADSSLVKPSPISNNPVQRPLSRIRSNIMYLEKNCFWIISSI